jgi:UDP-3-O-[3-hydroxymyristoyl] N-acetylglucosamine deacetylase
MLDAVGDLALAGAPLLASYRSVRGGHRLNATVLKALFADAEAWTVVHAPKTRETPHLPAYDASVGTAAVHFAANRN